MDRRAEGWATHLWIHYLLQATSRLRAVINKIIFFRISWIRIAWISMLLYAVQLLSPYVYIVRNQVYSNCCCAIDAQGIALMLTE